MKNKIIILIITALMFGCNSPTKEERVTTPEKASLETYYSNHPSSLKLSSSSQVPNSSQSLSSLKLLSSSQVPNSSQSLSSLKLSSSSQVPNSSQLSSSLNLSSSSQSLSSSSLLKIIDTTRMFVNEILIMYKINTSKGDTICSKRFNRMTYKICSSMDSLSYQETEIECTVKNQILDIKFKKEIQIDITFPDSGSISYINFWDLRNKAYVNYSHNACDNKNEKLTSCSFTKNDKTEVCKYQDFPELEIFKNF